MKVRNATKMLSQRCSSDLGKGRAAIGATLPRSNHELESIEVNILDAQLQTLHES